MANYDLLLLPGDGIGPEVMAEAGGVVDWFNGQTQNSFNVESDLAGGVAIDTHGVPVTDETVAKAAQADATILGSVGGPKWDGVAYEIRPEAGLLRLRKDLDLFANLRPAICYPALADASSLKRELVEGLDIMIVRELTGGTYFGEPKEITDLGDSPKFDQIEPMANDLMDRFVKGEIASAHVAYMRFHSAGQQRPEVIQLLPLDSKPAEEDGESEAPSHPVEFEFSPEPARLLDELLPATIRVRLFQCFSDAIVSEHIARMVAMKAAADAAGDMNTMLTRKYNRARQTQITMELLDIVGGVNALE